MRAAISHHCTDIKLFPFLTFSMNFCGPGGAGFPLHGVNPALLDLHHQMAEQYHVYSAAGSTLHSLSVAERLAGG